MVTVQDNIDNIKSLVELALKDLFEKDSYLFCVDANERSLTHKLAVYLAAYFPDYDVDCEYNRDGAVPKRLLACKQSIESDDTNAITVYPDIIIHKRGPAKDGSNFVVIEAKKRGLPVDFDRGKLQAYKQNANLQYAHAFLITLPVGESVRGREAATYIESV
jgi:hypothetical protein